MRKMFQQRCLEWTRKDKDVVILSGDFGYHAFDEVAPGQFLNFGPMEQTMVGVAAGLAIGGKYPILYAITPYIIERAFEQVKLDLVPHPAMIVTFSDYAGAGPTHQEIDAPSTCRMLGVEYHAPLTLGDCDEILNKLYRQPHTVMVQLSQRYVNHERNAKGELVCQ